MREALPNIISSLKVELSNHCCDWNRYDFSFVSLQLIIRFECVYFMFPDSQYW